MLLYYKNFNYIKLPTILNYKVKTILIVILARYILQQKIK